MKEMITNSVFFGVMVSILAYELGMLLKKKFKLAIFNPLLISIAVVIVILAVFHIDYQSYANGADLLSYLLTPATVCLAVPLYEQLELLKNNVKAIMAGLISGVFTSLISILALAAVFGFNHEEYVTLLPKSITTAIGMGVSEELGGIVTITVAVIIVTGILGNVIGEHVFRIFRIEEPIAKGVALGSASHAIGTAKAMELGEIEGAYTMINQQFVQHACMDYKYVNREEDTGSEGLRKAKRSYRPVFMVEKGWVREKTQDDQTQEVEE